MRRPRAKGHGVDGVNEAEAHGQAGGHEKGHGLHLRHTEEEEGEMQVEVLVAAVRRARAPSTSRTSVYLRAGRRY